MRKKTINNLITQLERTYNDKFEMKYTIAIRTKPVKHLVDFSCKKAASIGVIFSSNLFGNEIKDIQDNYMIRVRSQEILSAIEAMLKPFLECDLKIVFIPGSNVPLGTYSNMTLIDTIISGLDGFDEFIILSKDEITREVAEKIKLEFENRKLSFAAYLLGQVEQSLYDRIDEPYFDNNEIEEVSANCFSLFAEDYRYTIKESRE